MCSSVDLKDMIVEVFNAQREARDAHVTDGLQLVIGERAGFSLERDFLDFIPRQQAFHAVGKKLQLVGRKIARCAAAEIDELGFASADDRLARIDREFRQQRIKVAAHFGGIFVGIDFEVTEVTTLPAKGNVRVNAEGSWGS